MNEEVTIRHVRLGAVMSEADPKITHVRLCECGLPADHESVCRAVRLPAARQVDVQWHEEQAERRGARHAKRQVGFRAERHAERRGLSNQQLQALADIRAAKLSPIQAANIEPSHGGTNHPSVNLALRARSVDFDQDPRWKGADATERRALMRKHDLLDEYEGVDIAGADPDLTPEAKDAAIVSPDNAHLTASDFARQFPGYGTPSTVARKRRWFDGGHCTMNGLPPRSGCHCPTCRGAVL